MAGMELMSVDWEERRVLVTGATGMVGSAMCRWLVDQGAHVVAFVRDADPQSELFRSGTAQRVTIVQGRLEDYRDVERAINEHETSLVFHLGALTIVGNAYRAPLPTITTNVLGTTHVMEAARVHSSVVDAVVVASSDKAYGAQTQLPYTEETSLRGRAPYDVSKSCTDLISQSYVSTYGTPVGIARCGNIFGPGDLNWSRIVPGTIKALLAGEQPVIRSDGKFLRDYLYVGDVVSAYVSIAQHVLAGGKGDAFNFSPERPMNVLEVYEAVCLATVDKYVEPDIRNSATAEIRDQYLDATRAREVLGWDTATSIEDGLKATVPWYRDLLSQRR